jgi:hypothetical protein
VSPYLYYKVSCDTTLLLIEGVAIGVILIRRSVVLPLTGKQIALLKTFADQAAIAIENVRLFREAKEKNRMVEGQAKELIEWNASLETRVAKQVAELEQLAKLEHEILLASEIQKSMLPRAIPNFQGYEFCAHMNPPIHLHPIYLLSPKKANRD